MRKHEEKIFSGAAEPVHDAHDAANYGVCSSVSVMHRHSTSAKARDRYLFKCFIILFSFFR